LLFSPLKKQPAQNTAKAMLNAPGKHSFCCILRCLLFVWTEKQTVICARNREKRKMYKTKKKLKQTKCHYPVFSLFSCTVLFVSISLE